MKVRSDDSVFLKGRNSLKPQVKNGGDDGTRTHDPLLAKQVL
jgi:hypothetical protein